MTGAVPTLADRLRDGPRPTPAEALRAACDVALELDALHAAGRCHGQVEAARVELHPDGIARLASGTAPAAGPPETEDGRRADLRDLGRLLERALPAVTDGAGWGDEDALAAGGRAVARWLLDPGPRGAARASDAARVLAEVIGGVVFVAPADGTPDPAAPLPPHRLALRAACQGAGVGVIAASVCALRGDLAATLSLGVGWAVGGVSLTFGEEVARGRPGLEWPVAVAFGALTPALALLAGGVAWGAVAQGQLPVEALGQLVSRANGGARDLGAVAWLTGLFFLPGVAFAAARLRGHGALLPATWASLAAGAVVLCLLLARVPELVVALTWPLMAGLVTWCIALLAGVGLVVGRALEERILRAAARVDDRP